ncbi:hypothetical protein EV294_1054 [Paenibacillus sp. BK033]|nr:hypothetical protein EV294_1054 [Paenibacillus sp. BK033]
MKWRRLLSILFISGFVVSLIPLLFLIVEDKNNAYFSGVMFLAVVFFFLAVSNSVTYYMIKIREMKRR